MKLIKLIAPLIALLCLTTPNLFSEDPVIIHWSTSNPDSTLLSKHYQYWEEYLPFDGLLIPVNRKKITGIYGSQRGNSLPKDYWSLGWSAMGPVKLDFNEFSHAIDDIKNTPFTKFKNNFLLISLFVVIQRFDWSDEKLWDTVLHNIKIVAKIAKESGCKGIIFDTEQYGKSAYWDYKRIKALNPKTPPFNEYQKLIRKRGMEFINAINSEFPDLDFMLTFATSLTYAESLKLKTITPSNPVDSRRALLPAFTDGLLFGKNKETTIIDGNELSYYFKTDNEFLENHDQVTSQSKAFSQIPEVYSNPINGISIAFGLYPTHPPGPHGRQFNPEQFKHSINYSLQYTDKYVWIWGERKSFFWKLNSSQIPATYGTIHENYPKTVEGTPYNSISKEKSPIDPAFIQAIKDGVKIYQSQ